MLIDEKQMKWPAGGKEKARLRGGWMEEGKKRGPSEAVSWRQGVVAVAIIYHHHHSASL